MTRSRRSTGASTYRPHTEVKVVTYEGERHLAALERDGWEPFAVMVLSGVSSVYVRRTFKVPVFGQFVPWWNN